MFQQLQISFTKQIVKQLIYCLILAGLTVTAVQPQQSKPPLTVTDDDFQSLLVAVSNEEWNKTVALASQYLKQMKSDDERLPRLRYIYLYGAAGKTSEGTMEFEDLAKLSRDFVGKDIAVPYRPITGNCSRALNFICPSKDAKDKFMVAASNKTGTTILAFEYVTLKEAFDFSSHEGETASVEGVVQALTPNPNKSRAIVMRIYIANAVLRLRGQK